MQLILPGDFQEGAWPVSGCQFANPWTKGRCSGVQSPFSDDGSPVEFLYIMTIFRVGRDRLGILLGVGVLFEKNH
ncbi:hypothetical protein, partial [Klebsiella pneumoniae]|uniref:hypothetical protein n=1 Tax=Klebsiella pneumoniae TaxID=573 RepID=UPI001F4A7F68